jgi:GcrA cell cycle regulator
MPWTAEAVEDLKRLALEGRSASVIAAALGVASRNAVIGKANRIGIRLNGDGRAAMPRKARAERAAGAGSYGSNVVLARDSCATPGPRPGDQEGRRGAWIFAQAEIGEMQRVKFEEIRESACRWPLGDPRSGEFAYCGLTPAKGQSYCAGHCRLAYRPSNTGARQNAREQQRPVALANPWRPF